MVTTLSQTHYRRCIVRHQNSVLLLIADSEHLHLGLQV